jgi:hypothetical protein
MFQFLHAGQFLIAREAVTEDALTELALEAGADDIITTAEGYELRCALHAFDRIAHALDDRKIKPASAELAYIPTTTVAAPTGHLATDLAESQNVATAHPDVVARAESLMKSAHVDDPNWPLTGRAAARALRVISPPRPCLGPPLRLSFLHA